MTQQWQREAIVLAVAALAIARASYPVKIIDRKTKEPYENQAAIRLAYFLFAAFGLLVWYVIYREGR